MLHSFFRKLLAKKNGKPSPRRPGRSSPPRASYRPALEQFEDRTLLTTFAVTAPTSIVAGAIFPFTVTALDSTNATFTGYMGTVHFSSSDSQAAVPGDATLTNGVGTFSALLATAGNMTLTATDAANAGISGSAVVSVSPTSAKTFAITVPTIATAGIGFVITVTALDPWNNIATGYAGTVHFTSSDPNAQLPGDSTLSAGKGTFAVLLATAGNTTISASDSPNFTLGGTSGTIVVSPAGASMIALTAPANGAVGTAFLVTVTAQDFFGNTATGYGGTIHFSSSDPAALLPVDSVLTAGMTAFSVTLETPGNQVITATDTVASSLKGSNAVNVTTQGSAATHFAVSAFVSSITAGNPLLFTVTAEDQANNTVTGYTGTVHFTSSDGQAVLPADTALSGGFGLFACILNTAGPQTITATDPMAANLSGTTAAVAVQSAAVSQFAVSAPATAVTGSPFNFTVTAEDPFGNTAATYNGTVHFTSSGAGATLPGNATLASSVGTFSGTLIASGKQTLTATDTVNGNITGVSNTINALGLVVTSLIPTASGFIAQFSKAFDPTTLNLYDAASAGYGPPDVTLAGPSGANVRGSLVIDPSDTSFTFLASGTGPAAVLPAGTYTVTFRSATNGFKDAGGILLDGNSSGIPGSNYVGHFAVAATPVVVLALPEFARGPDGDDNIKVPNSTGTGIPVTLSSVSAVTDVAFTMSYLPALLTVSGVQNGPSGSTLTLVSNSGGVASFLFHSNTPLSGTLTLGQIMAQVPNSAAASYKAKDLLHLTGITVNGSSTTAVGKDGLEVVAYLGDVSGDGVYSPLDAALISRVAVNLDTGFAAYPILDPAIVGDLTNSGVVQSADVTILNRLNAGIIQPQLPLIPSNLPIPATGPDPTLSLAPAVRGSATGTLIVPVTIDTARPAGSTGIMEATLALRFDPRFFTATAASIQLGSLPASGSNWQLAATVNALTGEIGIDLFSTTPIQSAAGGTLVTITLHSLSAPPPATAVLSMVPQVNPTGLRVYTTTVCDAQGALVLHEAATTSQFAPISQTADVISLTAEPTAGLTISPLAPVGLVSIAQRSVIEQLYGDLQMLLAQNNLMAPSADLKVANPSTWPQYDSLEQALFDTPISGNAKWVDSALAVMDPPAEDEADQLLQSLSAPNDII